MSNGNWDHQEENRLAEFLVSRIQDKANGRSEQECVRNYPRDVYFIGNLRPRSDEAPDPALQPGHLRELLNKLAPMAFGAEFRLRTESEAIEVGITVKWACYYRIFPTFPQQCEHQRQDNAATTTANGGGHTESDQTVTFSAVERSEEEDETGDNEQSRDNQMAEVNSPEVTGTPRDRRRARIPQDSLFIRFRIVLCRADSRIVLHRDQEGNLIVDNSELQAALNHETSRAQQIAISDAERVMTIDNADEKIRVPEPALVSEAAYQFFLQSLHVEVRPEWRWEARCGVRTTQVDDSSEYVFALELVNASPMHEDSPNIEAFLFDTQASFEFAGNEVFPFQVDLAPRGFRYDRHVWGRGINSAVLRQGDESLPFKFVTTHVPIYRQMRFMTRTVPLARFEDLAQDPMPILDAILRAMEQYQ